MATQAPRFRPFLLSCLLLLPAGFAGAEDVPLDRNNVVIVLDASGSMGNRMHGSGRRKIDAAKEALREVLKRVPTDTAIGLLVFSAGNLTNDWAYPLGPRNDARLAQAIALPQPGDGTPLGEYLQKGANELLAQRARQMGYGTYRLLVVTDGEATDGNRTELVLPQVLGRGITVDVIGVDMSQDHSLATRVHSYRKANDPASLKRAVADVFAEVAGGGGKDAASNAAFDLLAPLPAPVVEAMLKALSSSGNASIRTEEAPAGGQGPAGSPSSPSSSSPKSGSSLPTWVYIVIIIAVVLFSRRKRR